MVKSVVQMVVADLAEHAPIMKPVPLTNLSVIVFLIVQPALVGRMAVAELVLVPAGKLA
jgi:hypothetical protein